MFTTYHDNGFVFTGTLSEFCGRISFVISKNTGGLDMPSTNNQVNLAATTYALYTTRTLTAQFSIRNTRPAYRLNQILRVQAVFVRHFLPTRGGGQQARKTRTFSHSRRPTTGNFSGHTPRKAGAGAGAADARPTGRGRGGVGGGGRPQLMRDAARPDRSRSNCSSNSSSSSVHSRSELADLRALRTPYVVFHIFC